MEGWRRFKRVGDQYGSTPFYGPPPLINDVVDCWALEDIRFFTELHSANGMTYHVMLPTDELEFHLDGVPTFYRSSPMVAQELIENGIPGQAIRVDVGKNGRAIVTHGADVVMAAKQVGLGKLPVIFNFVEEA